MTIPHQWSPMILKLWKLRFHTIFKPSLTFYHKAKYINNFDFVAAPTAHKVIDDGVDTAVQECRPMASQSKYPQMCDLIQILESYMHASTYNDETS